MGSCSKKWTRWTSCSSRWARWPSCSKKWRRWTSWNSRWARWALEAVDGRDGPTPAAVNGRDGPLAALDGRDGLFQHKTDKIVDGEDGPSACPRPARAQKSPCWIWKENFTQRGMFWNRGSRSLADYVFDLHRPCVWLPWPKVTSEDGEWPMKAIMSANFRGSSNRWARPELENRCSRLFTLLLYSCLWCSTVICFRLSLPLFGQLLCCRQRGGRLTTKYTGKEGKTWEVFFIFIIFFAFFVN